MVLDDQSQPVRGKRNRVSENDRWGRDGEMGIAATRLQAARLAAGYVVVKDAAERVGFSVATYRHAESAFTGLTDAILHSAASAFGVNSAYLRDGTVVSERDGLAARLASIIERATESVPESEAGEFPMRLREMRLDAGFRTAKDAASAHGWASATYTAHESGYQSIPLERQIGYALTYGVRPEFAVFGQSPKRPTSTEQVTWSDLRATGGLPPVSLSASWTWLRTSRDVLPVLVLDERRISLSQRGLALPELTMRALTETSATLFALMAKQEPTVLHLVDAQVRVGCRLVYVGAGGDILVEEPSSIDTRPVDPMRLKIETKTLIGAYVGQVAATVS